MEHFQELAFHDSEAEFLAEILQETSTLLRVIQLPIYGFTPKTDGSVKKFNHTVKRLLANLVKKSGLTGTPC